MVIPSHMRPPLRWGAPGRIDGIGSGKEATNRVLTLGATTSTVLLDPNIKRLYAIIQCQSGAGASVFVCLAGTAAAQGLQLADGDSVLLEYNPDDKSCEWNGVVSGYSVAGTNVGIIEVSREGG